MRRATFSSILSVYKKVDFSRWAFLAGVLFAISSSGIEAQQCTNWTQRASTGPSPRDAMGIAFDVARGKTVLFGGYGPSITNETWLWDGNSWTLGATGGPEPRFLNSMAYDSQRQRVVLFGGQGTSTGWKRDTWEWNGTSWSSRSNTGPSARHGHAMAYDSLRQRTVLFGGYAPSVAFLGDTWEWNGTSWTQRASSGPPPRDRSAMAFDEARGVTVLFGGDAGGFDTWEWNGTIWTQKAVTPPTTVPYPKMAYDSDRQRVVLFGGPTGANPDGSTWEWDGTTWTLATATGPVWRDNPGMAYDRLRHRLVLFGGGGGGAYNDTWELETAFCGPLGGALQFDGVNDLVRIPDSSSLDLSTGATIEFWCKPIYPSPPVRNGQRIVNKGDGQAGNTDRAYEIELLQPEHPNGRGFVSAFFLGSDTYTAPFTPYQWVSGTWVHFASTFSLAASEVRTYVNGQLAVVTQTAAGLAIRNSSYPLNIGAYQEPGLYFSGQLDEVRIWNIARSACDIEANYDRQVDPNTQGLVGYWRFDESLGNQSVIDSSPSANNGTLGNTSGAASDDPARVASTAPIQLPASGPDCNANGVSDACDIASGTSQDCNANLVPDECEALSPAAASAIQFDGVDDYVVIPVFGAIAPTSEITIEFWQKAGVGGGHPAFGLHDSSTTNRITAVVPWVDGAVYWQFGNLTTNGQLSYTPAASILGTWHHFAMVASQAGNYMRIYRNGVLEASKSGMTPFVPSALTFTIGSFREGGTLFPFAGTIDEFRIWNLARTQSQIQDSMNRRLQGGESGLISYYRFDEGSGLTAVNLAVTSAVPDGTLTNGAQWVSSSASIFEPNPTNDCDANGIPDSCDIAEGTPDCNANTIPDTCETNLGPTIALQPMGQTACAGQPVTFEVNATGVEPITYHWRKGLAIIPGATDPTFTINHATSADAGDYNVVLINSCGTTTSQNVTLTVVDSPTWTNLNPISGLSARRDHAIAFDWFRDRGVLFGGSDSQRLGDTWEWDGATWQLRAITGPSPRTDHAMAYDSGRRTTILFGGKDVNFNGQTWEWEGTSWALRSSSGPSPRTGHAMAYDAARGVTVLFGGLDGSLSGETWEWDGTSWMLRSTTGPSSRSDHTMAYDSVHSQVVLFGGYDGANKGDTWTWDGTAWTLRSTTGPGKRSEHTTAFDTSHGFVVLFGGVDNPTKYGDTWTWDGTLWRQVAVTGPSARFDHVAAYDSVRGRLLMNGGFDSALSFETWELTLSPTFSQQPQGQSLCVGTPLSFTAPATGVAPITYQWRKDGSNIEGATGNSYSIPSSSLLDAGAYDVVATDACGTVASAAGNVTILSDFPATQYALGTLCPPTAIPNASIIGFTDDGPIAGSCYGQRSFRMFAGQETVASGKLTRVRPGCIIQSFGPTLCTPESVLVDVHGRWQGICSLPNLLIVGACNTIYFINPANGAICEQFPDPTFNHIGQMAIDSMGRLFVGSVDGDSLNVIDMGAVEAFYSAPGMSPRAVTIDGADNVYVTTAVDGVMGKVAPDGMVIDPAFATGLTGAISQAIAPYGIFHGNMFVACGDRVMEVDMITGASSVYLSCRAPKGIAFDPEGYMHISIPSENKVLKIGPSLPGDMNGSGAVTIDDVAGFAAALLQLPNAQLPIATADMNGDGCADGRDVQLFVNAAMP